MSLFTRAISYAKPYKKTFALAILCNFIYAIFNIIALAFMMPILSILFDEKRIPITKKPVFSGEFLELKDYISDALSYRFQEINEVYGGEKLLLISCVLFLVAFLFRNIFSFFSEYLLIDLRSGVSRDFRKEMHDKLLKLPTSYFTEQRKGDMIARISGDVGEVESSILNGLVEIVRSPIMILVFFITLFVASYQLTLFTIIVFPIMGTLISLIGKSLKKDAGKAQHEFGKIMSFTDETLSYNKIIKIFNAESQIKKRFDKTLNDFRALTQKVLKKKALASPTSEFLGGITISLLVYFGGVLSLRGTGMQGSAFIFYIGIFYTMLDPIKRFAKSLSDIQKGEVSANRIFEVLDIDITIKDNPNAVSKVAFNSEIEFRNISFKYENKWILKNFNLIIPKGKSVALVGHSGSGKSTLANLITRFYDVNEGEILIDGINIKDVKVKDYRSLFGMVTQDSILFNDSIFNNIALGKEDATMDEVVKAAKISNAEEFIIQQENQYESMVGEGGGKLSGGQKQRLSIARAVFKNPPIMVLDEATSALDTQSERLVQDALEHMMENRTSLVIAHRLSTIKNADHIVVMDKGEIVEQGTHDDLMKLESSYFQFVNLQSVNEKLSD